MKSCSYLLVWLLTREPTAIYEGPIFAKDLNSRSPNSVGEYKKDDKRSPSKKEVMEKYIKPIQT